MTAPRIIAGMLTIAFLVLHWAGTADRGLILTLTLVAIIWYTAFAYEQIKASRKSAEATEHLAELQTLQARRAATEDLADLADLLTTIHGQVQEFAEEGTSENREPLIQEVLGASKQVVTRDRLDRLRDLAAGLYPQVGRKVLRLADTLEAAQDSLRSYHDAKYDGTLSDKIVQQVLDQSDAAYEELQAVMQFVGQERRRGAGPR